MKIIYLKMGFRPDLSDAGPADSPNRLKPSRLRYGDAMRAPDGTAGRILIRDTWNTEIVDGLKPQPGDITARSNHEASLLVIQALLGWVSRSDKFIGALERRAPRTSA